ncbi:hypothetical protein P153DRAFT_301453 [Dothidotthia symphoricarpi CBS 119687]|uniref:N-acetyltransferase domain-containing protein n=1 Tax=Dothidotthia symphoricarpi CBS 119687 TaxID=1392245 RepID=A0A6A6A0B5_9PLEO|nr:uncharacterized protein P153DRAFT_301453 [Dothidotthia symphoricarpi CBS 119687]KAF2124695.1 hypothetical protein P153DRAFT_301453 [Dothidotthia symphoricarpi CBS 119687]
MTNTSYEVAAVHENDGTRFTSILPPPMGLLDGYDNRLPCSKQKIDVPEVFRHAMAVREEVYGQQGIPLEAEFDEDDARSWHWVVYASVSTPKGSPTESSRKAHASAPKDPVEQAVARRPSASRTPVGTIRLIPPPHGASKYRRDSTLDDMHTDKDPPSDSGNSKHPNEPYVKLGRLAVLKEYRAMGLGKLLINAALDYATQHPDNIYLPPTTTIVELATLHGHNTELQYLMWQGLIMIHAQAGLQHMWEKMDFHEQLKNAQGEVEMEAEPHWMEEGIKHVGMWKRLNIVNARL